jgi:hypothetical protein
MWQMKNSTLLPLLASLYLTGAHAEPANTADINSLRQEMSALQQQLDKLTADQSTASPALVSGLQLSGFFDVTANISDINNHPFQLGDLEVDAVYDKAENFAVSAAGVVNDDGASIGVAVLDYHIRDHSIPARGALYEDAGFHLQLGRFDIPFATDYSLYAAPDRINISAPLTTDRILDGGLNGDGMRVYGLWSGLEYTTYIINSLYEPTGYAVGARIGYALSDNFVIGASVLDDQNENDNTRNRLTALDMGVQLGIATFNIEAVQLDSPTDLFVNSLTVGPADESGNHISMTLDFSPLTLFVRYESWTPDYTQLPDALDNTIGYDVEELKRVTLAARYVLDTYLQLKAEYFRYTQGRTAEPDFERHNARVQMVARF